MHILANALPGFRDLRGPVVAGYLWALFAWLIVEPDFTTKPGDPLGGSLYELGHAVGGVGTAIALSVAAYLVGSVSQVLSTGLRATWSGILKQAWYWLPRGLDDAIGMPGSPEPPEGEEISALAERASIAMASTSKPVSDPDQEVDVSEVAGRAYAEARAELALPATVLVGKEPELFAEVDRLRGEGDLRLAAVPPLVAIFVALTVLTGSWWWLVALIPLIALLDQGVRRLQSSRQLVADAKARGLVPSPALQRLKNWVEAVEARPDSPPPPPWHGAQMRRRRTLSPNERRRRLRLTTAPSLEERREKEEVLRTLSAEAVDALNSFAGDELSYAGTDISVGLSPVHPGTPELVELGLVAAAADSGPHPRVREEEDPLLILTDEGILVARLLTNPARGGDLVEAEHGWLGQAGDPSLGDTSRQPQEP
jgi:hypothetical protein